MPYNVFAVPFLGGLDTKSDPKSLAIGVLPKLENGVFSRRGSIIKRNGYDGVKLRDTSNNDINNTKVISARDDELFMTTVDSLYSYDSNNQKFIDRGAFRRVKITGEEVARNVYEQTVPDRAETNGVVVYAWEDSRGGVRYSVIDKNTGAKYIDDVQISATGEEPRCIAIGTYLHVIYAETGNTDLDDFIIDTYNPTGGSSSTIANDLDSDGIFSVCQGHNDTYALFVWKSTATNDLRWGRLLASGTTENKGDTGAAHGVYRHISCFADEDRLAILSVVDGTGVGSVHDLYVVFVDSPASSLTYDQMHGITTPNEGYRHSICLANDKFYAIYEDDTGVIKQWTAAAPGGGSSVEGTVAYGYMSGGAFTYQNKVYFICQHQSNIDLQNCNFVLEAPDDPSSDQAALISQFEYGDAFAVTPGPSGSIPYKGKASVWDLGDGQFSYACNIRRRFKLDTSAQTAVVTPSITDINDINYAAGAVEDILLDFAADDYTFATLNNVAYTAGGLLWHFDGSAAVETGFTLFPELDITVGATSHTAVSLGAGSLTAGTRGYRVYYEWINDKGHRIRSHAISFSVAFSGSDEATLTIPNLYFTRKDDVIITVYRTVAGGTAYYRVSDVDPSNTSGDNKFILNDRTATTVSFTDAITDANLTDNEQDPGDSVLASLPVPPGNVITASRRRVYLSGGLIPDNRIYYSKLVTSGQQVEFNDRLYIEVDEKGGPVTGLSVLNDRLVIFKERHIFYVAGDGPNNLGAGDFQQPVEITTDVGCIDPRTIVEIPQGVMFLSNRGIYLLHDNFQVTYIGQNVEAYNDQTFVSAELLPDENIVYFLTSSGVTLAFDYLFGQWSVFTNHEGDSAVFWNNTYVYLDRSRSKIYLSNKDVYLDDGQEYAFVLKTAPLRPDDLQRRFFAHRILVLGEYHSEHDIKLDVYRDRDGYPINSKTFDTDDFIDKVTWGSQATWGADSVWGGTGQDYQFQYTPGHSEYQTISIELTEVPSGEQPGQAFEITEVALEWSEAGGLAQIGNSRRG